MSMRQLELPESDDQLLEAESQRTGLSVSELVHRAVQQCYGTTPVAKPRLSWDEFFAHGGVRVNSAPADPWVYDPLFDDEWLDPELDNDEQGA